MDVKDTLDDLADVWYGFLLLEDLLRTLKDKGITSREFSLAYTDVQQGRMWFAEALGYRLGANGALSLMTNGRLKVTDAPRFSPN